MSKVFVCQPLPEPAVAMLKKAGHAVKVYPKEQIIPRAALLKGVRGVEAILSLLTDKIDEKVMDAAGPQLKIIANYAVGYNNIDVAAAKKRSVLVTNTPGVLTDSVAVFTYTMILASAKRITEADRFTRAGKYKGWGPKLLLGADLMEHTLGIVGSGRIGTRLAGLAKNGLNMNIIYSDVKRNPKFEKAFGAKYKKLDALLKEADFVTLHVPLLKSTRHLIGAKQFRLMKKTAHLINTSRGPVVDEKALVKALKTKQIAGAAIDVLEFEPKLTPGLAKLENVILTPHIASGSLMTRQKMAKMAATNIIQALKGKKPPNLVE
jgi:glyoxylate reductase